MKDDEDQGEPDMATPSLNLVTVPNGVRPGWVFGCVFVWVSFTNGRFLAPFLEQEIGMTPKTIGICLAAQSIIMTVGGTLVGPWADQREARFPGRGRTELLTFGVVTGTICALLHSLRHRPPLSLHKHESVQVESTAPEADTGGLFYSTEFHFALRMAYACSYCFIFPVIDAVALQYLEQHPQMSKDDYGRERLYGAIGWAITHVAYSILIDWFGFSITYPLILLGVVIALVAVLVFTRNQIHLTTRYLTKRNSDIVSDEGHTSSSSPPEPVEGPDPTELSMFSQFALILRYFFDTYYSSAFMLCLFILSFGQAIVDSLVFLFFETLDSSYTMMGITVVFTVAFEIPIFQIAPTLLQRSNAGILLLVASASYVVRVLGYASIPKGHMAYVLLLEPLHGVTYACSKTASVDTASRFSPAGWEATGQGLISLVAGFGSISGLLYGGWAVERLGGRYMYEISSCLVSFGALCLFVASCCQKPDSTPSGASPLSSGQKGHQYAGLQLQEQELEVEGNPMGIEDCSDESQIGLQLGPITTFDTGKISSS